MYYIQIPVGYGYDKRETQKYNFRKSEKGHDIFVPSLRIPKLRATRISDRTINGNMVVCVNADPIWKGDSCRALSKLVIHTSLFLIF